MKLLSVVPQFLSALPLCLALSVNAAPIAVAQSGKLRITLHDEAGPCVGPARLAVFEDGQQKVPGCWVVAPPDAIAISFLDGDAARVPMAVFRKPDEV